MPDVPNSPTNDDNPADPQDLQGYQDDFDTAQRDQIINEAGDDPVQDTPATRAEFAQGLRDSAAASQESGLATPNPDDPEPPMASTDDYREDIEDRDEDDKERSETPWQ